MFFARSVLALAAQALTAAILALRGASSPWLSAGAYLPVYGTLIDLGCLALLWRLTRREGIGLRELVGFQRERLGRDIAFGLALVPVALVLIFGGVLVAGWLVYGTSTLPYLYQPLPLWAALYGTLIWPLLWGLTEQLTYNAYLLPRLRALCRSTAVAVALVTFTWSFQHVVMPLTNEPSFWAFRMISPIPYSIFETLVYLRFRRLLPLAIAHALLDGAGVVVGVLLPALHA